MTEAEKAFTMLWDKLAGWLHTLILMLPNFLLAAIVLVLSYFIARFVRRVVENLLSRFSHSVALNNLIANLASTLLLVIGFFIALGILNLDKTVTSLLAGVGIIGLALGFAFQDIATNFISGVIIAVRKPFNIGDYIESGAHGGTITQLSLRTVDIRKFTGELVMIPNKSVFENPIINYTHFGSRRVELKVGVGYNSDLQKVKEVTREALKDIHGMVQDKDITLLYEEFGDSSIILKIWIWLDTNVPNAFGNAKSDAIERIKKAYEANNIEIPYPIRKLEGGAGLADASGNARPPLTLE